ncbi:hypothetical protein GH865_00075 [Rhodocyclus tenuis]|uniref:hypothetical protein n=1 Tax=Rhodocyclus gracilis TaxID=2929842 RepID=UPI0012989399|nr:hypothetical protein [Rhodocyclus gracilis]MRD71655.1 hypothetical protein [Rhodocyclus gracilis]
MMTHPIKLIVIAFCVVQGAGAMAQTLSRDEYRAGRDALAADYKAAKAHCASLSGNANDICRAEAAGKAKIARAELDLRDNPSRQARYTLGVARAEDAYGVAQQRCDDRAGNARDVCVKEAKAARITARAEARAQLTTGDANDLADEKAATAHQEASSTANQARREANIDKREAQYSVAREKCDVYAGEAKQHCLERAKAALGQP